MAEERFCREGDAKSEGEAVQSLRRTEKSRNAVWKSERFAKKELVMMEFASFVFRRSGTQRGREPTNE
jgi:hypothetical protein